MLWRSSGTEAVLPDTTWPEDVVREFDDSVADHCLIPHPQLKAIDAAVRQARVTDFRSRVTAEQAPQVAQQAMSALGLRCDGLAEDLVRVVHGFLRQFGRDKIALRLEIVDRATCPKFHIDNVYVRLIKTYSGPGTEWIWASAPDEIQHAPTGAILMLKGHQHPRHSDAVRHRSPQLTAGERRLCLVLDF
ncbi:DUF1826 domain-containing protein [Tuwongella immobilis]|uniref:DUF1826 domain-containing protein n=1 Tax=Tuwongella immobilis TaxID=692036 RepID=A0A6C2YT82_9BACT|nr:DUF1826 domain-containing protein [Tuwongella immobilis]VIP04092.1 Uncharacterized protein OS=Francisella sp. (strain TX077308) GN=F7308_1959 PE=4 SV=1: DUF1826 [Tuwongella immobilis]VTS05551.1 Uncharacterized protein OS=Francisella sp. (strain TX077308) GN=F7308_1959 PE=4 SV=1: DUF1826 [Tuwongella immobilis]